MKKTILSAILVCLSGSLAFSQGFYKLDWYDEFEGTELNLQKWDYQLGTGENGLWAWGNNEKEYYTKENASVRDGFLVITAKREARGGMPFTSSRLTTRGRYYTTFGRIEARISLPAVTGMWPAFWMLPQNSPYGGWATSGEIDIMEARGRTPNVYGGTIHYGGPWGNGWKWSSTGDRPYPAGTGNAANFHVYAVEWTADKITWFCDGTKIGEKTEWYANASIPKPAPFDVDFHIILNLAVGGDFDGGRMPPDDFQRGEMKVDYVRVYKWSDTLTEPEIPQITGINLPKNIGIGITQTSNEISIQSAHALEKAVLYSLNGQTLVQSNSPAMDVSILPRGIYLLKVRDCKNAMATFKVFLK